MRSKARLGDRLQEAGHITAEQLEKALARKQETGQFLGDVLVDLGFVSAEIVGHELAEMVGVPYVRLADAEITPEAVASVPEAVQRAHDLVALRIDKGALYVAMADPLNVLAVDDLQLITGLRVVPRLALRQEITDAHRRLFSVQVMTQDLINEIAASDTGGAESDLSVDQLAGLAEDAPIIRLVDSIVAEGVSAQASDIHIEPQDDKVRVRYRMDGVLVERMAFPLRMLPAVVSRVKIMAHMNIAERRRPQDGRVIVHIKGGGVELRVSTMLLAYGEKVVMRILDKRSISVPLEHLGFLDEQMYEWIRFMERPHGILLVTGPTGSGKSTTLYTSLTRLNDEARNVITIEDPIEYDLAGVNQSQVNARIGVTFAAGLRTIVRQDPDVIMVGEIRDGETAEIAVQAALTGHLVLSTLHTNDAPGALVRLQNLGVEPFLVASSVIGVAAQRLVRKVCPHCATPDDPDPRLLARLGLTAAAVAQDGLRRGEGCAHCEGRGMRGRTAAYEVMPISPAMQDAVLRQASGIELKALAMREGMVTMCEAGVRKALAGEAPLSEVQRVLLASDSPVRPGYLRAAVHAERDDVVAAA